MTHVHVRRWRNDEWSDDAENPGTMSGSIADLTPETEPPDDGLVMPDGSAIPRPEPKRRPFGFLPPDRSVER